MLFSDFAKGKIWGILPSYLKDMLHRLPDMKEAKDLAVKFTENPEDRDEYLLRDGVAIIPITGPISKRRSFFSFFYGGAPLNILTQVFMDAIVDPKVEAIVLDMDSPGGTVAGTEAFGDLVFNSRDQKPIVAFANGMMTSAAYWIGSGAHEVVVERTADVGSIGVVMVHYDWSKEDEKMGLKRTVLSAGKYKALGNDAEPLSKEAEKVFQAELDYVYTLFVDTVARNRNVSADTVLKGMADGKIFIGEQAVDAGLADKTGSLDTAIEAARALVESDGEYKNLTLFQTTKEDLMKIENIEQLKEAYPDLVKKVEAAAVAGVDTKSMLQEARNDERDRVMGLVEVQFGAEDGEKFKTIVEADVTVDQFKAIKAVTPETAPEENNGNLEQVKTDLLKAIQDAGPDNPGANSGVQAGEKPFMVLVQEYMTAHSCDKGKAILAVTKSNPAEHEAYLKEVNPAGNA